MNGQRKRRQVLNEMKLSFPARSANEAFARVSVAAFAAQLDPDMAEITELKTAISEAVTNCVVHAYQQHIGMVYITATLYEDAYIRIRIRDKGCGIDDVKQAMQPLYSGGEEDGTERAGMGFTIMQSFTDSLRVSSKPGAGTTVTMYKKIRQKDVEKHA